MGSAFLTLFGCIFFGCVYCETGAFTNYVNMEKLYTLEDDLITITDVILRQEKVLHGDEDTHGIYNITSTVEHVKSIHRQVVSGRNLSSYIVNPVNIYHMTKRLAKDWTKVIATIEESKSCVRAMRAKVGNIADNMPSGGHLKHVIRGVLRLQVIYNMSVSDVMSGKFADIPALSSLSLDDAFEFARVAYESDQYYLAVVWLKEVVNMYKEDEATFALRNAMSLLSSAYLKLHRPKDALAILDELIKTAPDNQVARRNSKYIIQKMDEGMRDIDVNHQEPNSKKDKLLQKHCNKNDRIRKLKRHQFCTYTGRRNMGYFERPSIKTEVLSRKPLIVLYRNMTTSSEQKAVAHLGYEQMRAVMYKNRYTHPQGMDGLDVQDNTNWQWIPNLQKTLENIDLTEREPLKSRFIVKNIGLYGMSNSGLVKSDLTRLGTFVVFLTEPQHGGGDVVFPSLNINVAPEKGTVLFYERKVHKQANVCPVIADTQWVGIYPLEDQFYSNFCYKDNLRRPSRK
ncbi:prolyl 4-hydroxylase subunit alpha-3-like [Ruditapes philippinarum]|uniref:prolyl 4-hydroxylase subunit alpha-3-like n=1 Tax=Ruditapes philippinarum TaxID=129788 RepID=UPI00295B045F|nr:prolyl 4-hydroxylase subunit alpha-3-like [Ruditapes philippinarum]